MTVYRNFSQEQMIHLMAKLAQNSKAASKELWN